MIIYGGSFLKCNDKREVKVKEIMSLCLMDGEGFQHFDENRRLGVR